MSFDTDALVDRRRLKRHLIVWRAVAVVALVALVVVAAGRIAGFPEGRHIARLTISGVIAGDTARDEALARIATDSDAEALIVHIDSPGGTVLGGEALFHGLRAVAAEKPVVAVMDTVATSAGYMTALGADYIIARQSSLTGSIGVILQTTDITGLLEKLGITTEAIKSGPLKAVPSPFEPLTDEAREVTRAVVLDIFDMFVDMVADRRGLTREAALEVADGRIFAGRQALAHRLIDALGGESEAIEWLETNRGIEAGLPVRDVEIERDFNIWSKMGSALIGKTFLSERLSLDGLISLWHPKGG